MRGPHDRLYTVACLSCCTCHVVLVMLCLSCCACHAVLVMLCSCLLGVLLCLSVVLVVLVLLAFVMFLAVFVMCVCVCMCLRMPRLGVLSSRVLCCRVECRVSCLHVCRFLGEFSSYFGKSRRLDRVYPSLSLSPHDCLRFSCVVHESPSLPTTV